MMYFSDAAAIAVGVVGGMLALALSAVIIYYITKKRAQVKLKVSTSDHHYATFTNVPGSKSDSVNITKFSKQKQK